MSTAEIVMLVITLFFGVTAAVSIVTCRNALDGWRASLDEREKLEDELDRRTAVWLEHLRKED
jgi:hypothetical protein